MRVYIVRRQLVNGFCMDIRVAESVAMAEVIMFRMAVNETLALRNLKVWERQQLETSDIQVVVRCSDPEQSSHEAYVTIVGRQVQRKE